METEKNQGHQLQVRDVDMREMRNPNPSASGEYEVYWDFLQSEIISCVVASEAKDSSAIPTIHIFLALC